MRKLLIDIADLGGRAMPDDKVTLWAPFHRESSSNPSRVVSTARVDVILDEEGKAEVMVEPGPLNVQFKCRGFSDTEVKRAVVPDDGDGDVNLVDLIAEDFKYEPEVVSAVRQAAEMARLAANRVGTAEQVGVWADTASTAAEATGDDRRQTGEDRSAVESAAVQVADDRRQTGEDRVATGEDRAHIDDQFDLVTDYVDQNVDHVDSQVEHVDNQVVHVDGQVTHVDSQVEHADSVRSHVDSQSTFVDSARTIVEEAVARVGTAEQVEFWHDGAVEAAGRAETTASGVQAIVDSAADVIRAEIGDNVDRAESAAVKAEQHEAGAAAAAASEVEKLKGDAPEAFDTLGEIADELARNETERAALANSIGEKARREEVDSALAGKSDIGHGHVVGDTDGLDVALESAGKSAEWGSVSGKPSVFPPEDHRHPADQIDNLDALIDQRARALVVEASSAHFWDGQGTWQAPWWAGPNDRVFNLDTNEIHSVQEVQ